MPFPELTKYLNMAKRQGYYIARQAMIKNGYSLNEVAIMLTFRLNQIAEEETLKRHSKSKWTDCPINQFPAISLSS